MWSIDAIADAAAAALEKREHQYALEQAVSGIDSLDEVDLHPILHQGFLDAGFGAWREQPYPAEPTRRPRHRERERCDLVLTLEADAPILDPVHELLEQDKGAGTLFEHAPADHGDGPGTEVADAFWLEVKTTGQYLCRNGIPGANTTYVSDMVIGPMADIRKLARDPIIEHAGMLLVLFSEDESTAEHDMGVLVHRCLDKDLPVTSPVSRSFAVRDLIGNCLCSLMVIRVRSA